MMTLHTTDDLLRAARENQEFRDAFRREILTDDLLDLPQREGDHYRETNTNIEALTETVNVLSRNVDTLVTSIADMNRNINEKIDEISISHREEHEALHRFRGNYAIEATQNNRANIARKFIDARGINRHRYRLKTLSDDECNDLFDENLDTIELLDTEGNISETFPEGDLIARAYYRRSEDTIFYIAVEASYTINADDVIRASDHAKILRETTGHEAFAIVSGVRVDPEITNSYAQRIIEDLTEYLNAERNDVVFFFQLTDRSLEPTPPC